MTRVKVVLLTTVVTYDQKYKSIIYSFCKYSLDLRALKPVIASKVFEAILNLHQASVNMIRKLSPQTYPMEYNTGQYIRPRLKNFGGIIGSECNWDRATVLCSITIRIEHDNNEHPCAPICQCTTESAITIILPHLPVIQWQSNRICPGKGNKYLILLAHA